MGKVHAHKIELATAAPALEGTRTLHVTEFGSQRCAECCIARGGHGSWITSGVLQAQWAETRVPVAWSIMVWAVFDITWRRSSFLDLFELPAAIHFYV